MYSMHQLQREMAMKKIYMLLAAVLLMVMTGCGGGDDSSSTPSSAKAITAFYLYGVVGTIDEAGKTIAVTMPYGTDVTSLVAMFRTTGSQCHSGYNCSDERDDSPITLPVRWYIR